MLSMSRPWSEPWSGPVTTRHRTARSELATANPGDSGDYGSDGVLGQIAPMAYPVYVATDVAVRMYGYGGMP